MNDPVAIRALDSFVYRCPLDTPVETSFGTMMDRPMVVVRVTDQDGHQGWGEIWCNFPMVGAEHRARLVDSVFRAQMVDREFDSPAAAYQALEAGTRVLALQSAEPGPFAQCLSGIDLALWDLCARRAGQPLWQYLGGDTDRIPVYASGLNPTAPERLAVERAAQGYTRFKLKIGFGARRDLANLAALRETLGDQASLMVDVNQGWTLDQARDQLPALNRLGLKWIEEPLLCTAPWSEWRALAALTDIPVSAGENLMGEARFREAIDSGALSILQPDAAKWGGISRLLPLARAINNAGLRYYPHYLGGGIGLLASGHLLAAAGGEGALEVDANPNPLRTELCGPLNVVEGGYASLGRAPGIGDLDALAGLECYRVGEYL
ncbi:L-alanine-dl-glutamate epimerase and related enzymes of enolase superfamily [Alloalcanivorax dieselolei B5]|uniref:L-alanine-dl-glutamate epimerase and related enzymes of enolase superfamily n=1 Tax=Alcanivorax dieselolei (strain DSM 16502 / CGMCC 1.3690 / MCCC 1A00001 / B-5) TaxID=930169 RepID=K0CJU3_ALCDB|nr:mandelate racemase/muconate lactonizing enzyme family protein [Alloalcanivorax dieselolei]AFT71771.1 L-alanine-dl-glutamate epimerase and related enzymes of enolase superfamily [Alloalcanivorax dieselolei B5]GGK02559.1 mandelate racemase [Alloalcanivorax dieselolei]